MSFFHSRLLTHSESLRKNTTAIHIFGTNTFHISKKTKTNDISRTKSTMYVCVMCVFCISNWTLFDFFLVIRKNLRHVFFLPIQSSLLSTATTTKTSTPLKLWKMAWWLWWWWWWLRWIEKKEEDEPST